jgi:DNA-binding FrmR family transcriptional regulator
MYFKRQNMRAQGDDQGINTAMEDLDEFDRIVQQISMISSINPEDYH